MHHSDKARRAPLLSWAFYDWANSAFATTVISGFFPLFFKQYWGQSLPVTTSTFYLGLGNSLASLVIIISAPILGAMVDQSGQRKHMLLVFASIGIFTCLGLSLVESEMWSVALFLYVIALIGFSGANIFYDSLLVIVSSPANRHRDSAFGYAIGYLGGGLLFLFNVVMTLYPQQFGFESSTEAVKFSFINVSVWWAIFTLPLIFYVKTENTSVTSKSKDAHSHIAFSTLLHRAIRSTKSTIAKNKQHRNVWIFLLAYWLYIDGVATIVRMGVDYGLSIGLPSNSLIIALLMVQFIGFPATLVFGRLAERIGVKKGLWLALAVYVFATIYAYFMNSALEFYVLAGLLGLVQGAVQTLSRSFYSQIIPKDKVSEYFGFQNMIGKSAAFIGPVMVGTVAYVTNDSRLGILSVLILFLMGMFTLRMVDDVIKG